MEPATETKCPICCKNVTKNRTKKEESDIDFTMSECFNEFYVHTSEGKLIVIKHPKTPWSNEHR